MKQIVLTSFIFTIISTGLINASAKEIRSKEVVAATIKKRIDFLCSQQTGKRNQYSNSSEITESVFEECCGWLIGLFKKSPTKP